MKPIRWLMAISFGLLTGLPLCLGDDETVVLRRLTVPEYIATVQSAVGVDIGDDARRILPPDLRADGFSNTAYNLTVDLGHVEAYARLAQIIVGRMDVDSFAAEHAKCRELNDACQRELISKMGKWLLRGPLEEREIAAYLEISRAVGEQGGNFTEATGYVIEAMLQSPRFIYRIERQSGDGAARPAGEYELASRLSYILWGGPPDKELMRAADAGELSDPPQAKSQVRRMLEDPRAIAQSSRFLYEWLNLARLDNIRPSEKRFPTWNPALADDMREESLAFFRHVAWEQRRPLSDLLNAQVTFVTPRLARHYGLHGGSATGDPSGELALDLPQSKAAGLLALYTFREGNGAVVHDVSESGEPLDLTIEGGSGTTWGPSGLDVAGGTLVATPGAAKRLTSAVKKSKAITLEAWITPADRTQAGPARIVTLSANTGVRNFTLGQDGDKFDVRLRSTKTDGNGIPSLAAPSGSLQTRPTHVVFSRDAGGKGRLYINGEETASSNTGGEISNWDDGFRLALANELTKDRLWSGTFHLVAIYDRAFSGRQVQAHHAAGPPAAPAPGVQFSGRRLQGLEALYRFGEGKGDLVRDTSGAGEPLDLKIADASRVAWEPGGLAVNGPVVIASTESTKRLVDAVKKSKELTLEAWITPADAGQSGPARILSFSADPNRRNFTLGQDGDKYDVRLRTTKTSENGIPSLAAPSGSVELRPTHVAYTRDAGGTARFYVNGEERAAQGIGGDLSSWDAGFRLALANELSGDRPWRGTFHLVAVYSRALSAEEIKTGGDFPAPAGEMSHFDLSATPARGGLLTQGSVLTIGGEEASMVSRGLFLLHNLLEGEVEDPPPCVDTTPVPAKPGQSRREISEIRVADLSCGGCHERFEPLAFGLEKFNGLGAFQEIDEHGNKLREDGEIRFPDGGKPVAYGTTAELMDLLAGSDRVRRTIARKVVQFAIGRPLTEADEPLIDEVFRSSQREGGTYAALITAVVMSDLVRKIKTAP